MLRKGVYLYAVSFPFALYKCLFPFPRQREIIAFILFLLDGTRCPMLIRNIRQHLFMPLST